MTNFEPPLASARSLSPHRSYCAAGARSLEELLRRRPSNCVGNPVEQGQPSTVDLVLEGDDAFDSERRGRLLLRAPDACPYFDAAALGDEHRNPSDASQG